MSAEDLVFAIVGLWVGAGLMAIAILTVAAWAATRPAKSVPPRAAQIADRRNDHHRIVR